jgi:hypothetical protein
VPTFGEQRLEEVIEMYGEAADAISAYMAELPFIESPQERREIYLLILAILGALRDQTREWAEDTLREVYVEADNAAIDAFDEMGLLESAGWGDTQEAEIEQWIGEFTEEMEASLDSVQATASQLRNRRGLHDLVGAKAQKAIAVGALAGVVAIRARQELRDKLRQSVVQVITENGDTYRYSMDYYVAMSANHKIYAAMTAAALARCAENGYTLVQVSPNPSKIGDYCDEYRSKVFSTDGSHPQYPHISELPGGTCPMHPHCKHTLSPFFGNDVFGEVDPRFRELAMTADAGPNDFQKLWREIRAG